MNYDEFCSEISNIISDADIQDDGLGDPPPPFYMVGASTY